MTDSQVKALKYSWQKIVNGLGPDTAPSAVTFAAVQTYLFARRQTGARGQSIIREVQALKRGLRQAVRRGWLPVMPDEWPIVRRDPPKKSQQGKLHPPSVIAAWLSQLKDDARDEAELAIFTSLRAKELKRITAQWIEPTAEGSIVPAVLRIPAESAKSRRERIVPLVPRALSVLKRRMEVTPPGHPLLAQGNHKTAYRAAARRISYGARITLRDLRHTFASLATRGVGVDAARDMLGHTSLAVTSRYISTDMTRLASAALSVAGTVASAQEAKMGLEWSGQPDSNRRPPAPKTNLVDVINHIAECDACYQSAQKRLDLHVVDGQVGTGGPAQVVV